MILYVLVNKQTKQPCGWFTNSDQIVCSTSPKFKEVFNDVANSKQLSEIEVIEYLPKLINIY